MEAVLDLRPIAPAAIVAVTGVLVLLSQAFTAKGRTAPSAALSLAGLVAALASVWLLASGPARGAVLAGAVTAEFISKKYCSDRIVDQVPHRVIELRTHCSQDAVS